MCEKNVSKQSVAAQSVMIKRLCIYIIYIYSIWYVQFSRWNTWHKLGTDNQQ